MNPFLPILVPGSPLTRVPTGRQSRVRQVVFLVLAVKIFAVVVLLIQSSIRASHTPNAGDTSASNARASSETTNTPSTAQLPVTVLRAESHAPVAAAPVAAPKPAPLPATPAAAVKNYSVVKGDNYYKIAKANDVSVSALAEANPGVEPSKLKIGQVLHIPVAGQKPASPPPNATHASVKEKQ